MHCSLIYKTLKRGKLAISLKLHNQHNESEFSNIQLKKRKKVFTWLRGNKYNIIFLQETHVTKETAEFWQNEWGYTALFSGNNSQSAGIAILFESNFPVKLISHKQIIVGRI